MDKTSVGLILLVGGGAMVWKGSRLIRQLQKYEFEHRTDGGVVEFDTFEESLRHKGRGSKAVVVLIVGGLMFFFGLMIVV